MAFIYDDIHMAFRAGSYDRFCRIIPILQAGMKRLWSKWEAFGILRTPYGVPLIWDCDEPWGGGLGIYTRKEASVDGTVYKVIAPSVMGRTNEDKTEREIFVNLLAYKKGGDGEEEEDGEVYLLTGSYIHTIREGYNYEADSIPGYLIDGVPSRGLIFGSAIPFRSTFQNLAAGGPEETNQIPNVRVFIDTMERLILGLNTRNDIHLHAIPWDEDALAELLAKSPYNTIKDVFYAIERRTRELLGDVDSAEGTTFDGHFYLTIDTGTHTSFNNFHRIIHDPFILCLLKTFGNFIAYHNMWMADPATGKKHKLTYGIRHKRTYTLEDGIHTCGVKSKIHRF